ncbi:uncharacterized protein A4U43_UnF2230 [Asparagus officinalis]|uniref:Uncharacterized protein n=1 Tax=Asparagus officinalis TaxID=4686 RepID=A0A1R3L7E0_ASPOF|nr:uncharacterized protein A4U43_UnF2230 [Asparagus officinalis]
MPRSTRTSSRASKRSAMPIFSPAAARGSSLLRPSTSMMAAASDPLSRARVAFSPSLFSSVVDNLVVPPGVMQGLTEDEEFKRVVFL